MKHNLKHTVWFLQQMSLSVKVRLKEAEEARTLCVSIEGLECSKDMVTALTAQHDGVVQRHHQNGDPGCEL